MSNYLAIATVTAVLRDILQEAAGAAVPGATVTTRRPEAINDGGRSKPVVNIFLYGVVPNAALRNTEIQMGYPARQSAEDRASDRVEKRPQLPLNLNYLVSFSGNELELEPQRLLGGVVSKLHAHPRLSPETVRDTVKHARHLKRSDLEFQVAQIEHVKLTPVDLNLEELSKLWSVFFQVPYALSVAYEAATVLLDAGAPREPGIVREVHVEPPEAMT